MGFFPSHYTLYNRVHHTAVADRSFLIASAWPPQERIPYNQHVHYGFSTPAAIDNHKLLGTVANIDTAGSSLMVYQSHSPIEHHGTSYPVATPPTNYHSLSSGAISVSVLHNEPALEPDFNFGYLTSYSSSVAKQSLVNDTTETSWPSLWSSMTTQKSFESQSGLTGMQNASSFRQSWLSWNTIESPVGSGTTHYHPQAQYSPSDCDSLPSWMDIDLSQLPRSPVTLTNNHPQSRVLHDDGASTESTQGVHRRVGSAAIVRASRRRRGINPKSGVARSSLYHCPEHECIQLNIEFTSKHNFKDHIRRHAGQKPFKCTICQDASFTNRSDLNRHQTSEKCINTAGFMQSRSPWMGSQTFGSTLML
ncbi:hypothetical protein GYMLUDRAFT_265892 [Collybiopsis luxurians FD-317 M1]|uniref:C2H2-type domain-containing protein n=1 Tax=Collybiopsis luxurians FD-317 M1 TaxID=944289 RepID=A0A0D0C0X8_9AGAR|nr:hypothetical protein GYMLUDRAFT_265892 [Collybiopsis luxurians FD-317 M1]